jgi:hypothetical protein
MTAAEMQEQLDALRDDLQDAVYERERLRTETRLLRQTATDLHAIVGRYL